MSRCKRIAAGLLAVAVSAVVAGDTMAQDSLHTCEAQQSDAAAAVVVTPTPTPSRAVGETTTAPSDSQVTAEESGLPRPVDTQGEPVAGAVELKYAFGPDRAPITRHQAFLIPEDMILDDVTATVPFQDVLDADGRPLSAAHLRAVVQPTGPGRVVTVGICMDPDSPTEMRAGTYTGTALVGVGERVAPVTIQATVQDDRLWLVIVFALAGVTGGLFIRLFADKQSTGHIEKLSSVSTPRIITTVAAGLIVAFYSIRTIYLDDPTFYAGAGDLWRITAETFAGTLAAKTLTDLGGQQKEAPAAESEKKPETSPGASAAPSPAPAQA